MPLSVHGAPGSTCTARVLMTLAEKEIPYTFVPVDFRKGEHKSPAHVAHQPFGQVPFIEDDGFYLYESRAICRYLALKYAGQGTKLGPTPSPDNLHAVALFEQAASVEVSDFEKFASPFLSEMVFSKYRGLTPNAEKAEDAKKGLARVLDVYEGAILSQREYVAGDEFSLVDLFHIPYLALLGAAGAPELIESRPNVKKWWEKISARESWKKTQVPN